MGDLSKHFDRSEFSCRCDCGYDTADKLLVDVLEDVRTYFNAPIIINSAARCEGHNKYIGGMKSSYHLIGKAADIRCKSFSSSAIYRYIDEMYPNMFGLKLYTDDDFVHIDVRPGYWRDKQ